MKRKRLMLLGVLLFLVTFPIGSLADSKLNKGLTNSFTNPPLKTGKIDKSKEKNKNNTNTKKKDKGKGSDGEKNNTVDPKNLLEIQEQGIKKILGDDYDKYVKDAKKLGTDIDSKKETQKKLIDAATYDTFDRPLFYDQFKEDLDRFTSKTYFKGDFLGFSSETNYLINSFVQAIFWVNKTIFSMMATIYDSLDKNSSLNTQIVDILNIAGDTYNSLMTSQVLLFVGGLFVSYAYYEYVKRGGGFFTSLLKLFVTFGVVTIFFTKSATGDYYLTRAYTNVDSALTGVASSVSKLENAYSSKGYGEGSPLDSYFEQAIWEPYAYMNADKVSEDKAKYKGLKLNLSEKDLKALLAYDSDDKKFKLNDKTMEEIVYNGDKVKIKNLSNNWGDKFSYAIGSIFKTTVLGIVIDAFAIFRFVLRIALLILFVLSPFVALISFIPTMQIVLLNFAKRIGITVGLSGFMDFFAIMALFIYKMIDDVVSTFFNNYLLVVFVEIIVLVMLWKKRDWLVSILTADRLRVSSSFGRFPNRLKRGFKGTVRSRRYGGRSLTNDMTKMAVARQAVKGIRNRSLAGLGRGTVKGISGLSRAGQMGFAMAGAGYSKEAASQLVHAQSQARKDRFNQLKANFGRGLNHLKYNTLKLAQDGTRDKALKSHLQGRAGDVRLSGMQLASDKERARRKANVSKQRVSRLKEAHQLKQNQQREKQMIVKSVEDIRQKTGMSAKEAYKKYSHDQRLERRTSDYSQAKEKKTVKPKMTKESHTKRSAPKQKVTPNGGKKPKVTSSYSHEQLKSKLRRSSLKR